MKRFLLPLIILISGFGLAALLIATGPELKPMPVQANTPLVRTLEARFLSVQLNSSTHGTVAPRTESELIPEVSGRVVAMSPAMVSGGFFNKGDVLITVDPLDYEVALEQARANLARANSDHSTARKTHARQLDLAKKQSISESQMDDAQNRLHIAKASLRESNARLARAERDLDRTRLTAPYDGRVRTERVDVGQFVSRGVSIATIYATDIVEVKLPIHDDELAFLDIPLVADGTGLNKRVPVTLRARFAGAEHQWSGEIVRTEGELDPRTRMINLIAQVSSPYDSDTDKPPLAVGLFVQADIHGLEVDDMVIMPRAALRGRSSVFVVDQENRLRSRAVEVLRIADDQVFIGGGLNPGERVCISPLDGALDGMLVRVQATGKPVEISDS